MWITEKAYRTEEAYRDVRIESLGISRKGFFYELIYGNLFWVLFLSGALAWLWLSSRKSRAMMDEVQESSQEAVAASKALARESIDLERRLLNSPSGR